MDDKLRKNKEANESIIEVAKMLNIDTDGIGFGDTQLTLDDFLDASSAIAKKPDASSNTLHIADVMPMLHKIAKCFDDYLEDLDPKDCTEDLSNAVELMRDIADDNSMFIRN